MSLSLRFYLSKMWLVVSFLVNSYDHNSKQDLQTEILLLISPFSLKGITFDNIYMALQVSKGKKRL